MLPTSPELAKLQIPETGAEVSEATFFEDVADDNQAPVLMRSASPQSIGKYQRSELRSLDILPRSPTSPRGDLPSPIEPIAEDVPETPVDGPSSRLAEPSPPVSPLEDKSIMDFPSPPNIPVRTSSLTASPESGRRSSHRRRISDAPSSPLSTDDYDLAPAPLRKARSKRKYNDVPLPTTKSPTASSTAKSKAANLSAGGDNFDRHVSEVLDRVHAPIRFKSRPGAETPQPSTSRPEAGGKAKSYSRLQQPKLERQQTKSMTLAPAEISPKKSSTASEPEVKLYHLTQAGRTEPIKLFVRLVGEGERVMVRVGGGWADLADYLRQYAEHHGSRTVSEGMLEMQTAAGANSAMGARRTFSTPAVPAQDPKSATSASASAVKGTPTPVVLERAATITTAADFGGGSVDRPSWLSEAQPRFTMGDSDESDYTNTPNTPTLPHLTTTTSRPGTANGTTSRLPTSRPQSRQTLDGNGANSSPSFGMAGPSSANAAKVIYRSRRPSG